MTPFLDFLAERGALPVDDALAAFLPLVRQVISVHDTGRVAPLHGPDHLRAIDGRLGFDDARAGRPVLNEARVRALDRPDSGALEIVDEVSRTTEIGGNGDAVDDLHVADGVAEITKPVYLPGYVAWEHRVGHHDPVTDVYSLGLVLASLSCGLNFTRAEDLRLFVRNRRNLFHLRPDLNAVVARTILRMTDRFRHRRTPDLRGLLATLDRYRELEGDFDQEVARLPGFHQKDLKGRRAAILARLQERLFEISKRNRLLHFRPTLGTVNLTYASVPLLCDVRSIRPEQLVTWNPAFRAELLSEKPVPLANHLRFEEHLYLPGVLDRIRTEAQRDQAEFGFEHLRLVLCFLRWSDLKQSPPEFFDSPLALLPVRLARRKGVRDVFTLQAVGTVAEVNPVLRHHLHQLYGIRLPESVDLSETTLDALHELLEKQVRASEPGITIEKIVKPRIDLIVDRARRRLDQYRRRLRAHARGARTFMDIDYSYTPENFLPLGLRLFHARVRPAVTRLSGILGDGPPRPAFAAPPPAVEKERTFYSLRDGDGGGNPYTWSVDFCRVTLGSFKYRQLSLVRDYETLLQEDVPHPVFDTIFSLSPRKAADAPLPPPPLEESFPIVTADPTQATAVAQARAGRLYIIQGPPGTGKSQTIANLIADFVAQGRRVLFVCEKRAAIDVVHHRLRQQGLHVLACLVHDAQSDKKQVLMDLRALYEEHLQPKEADDPEATREATLKALREELKPVEEFDAAMGSTPEDAGVPMRRLIGRAAELRDALPPLPAVERERLPPYADWVAHADAIVRYVKALADVRPDGIFASHPLSGLDPVLARAERPLERTMKGLEAALEAIARAGKATAAAGLPFETPELTRVLSGYAHLVLPLADGEHLDLLDPASAGGRELERFVEAHRKLEEAHQAARTRSRAWREDLPREELRIAMEQARGLHGRWFGWLSPTWWRLRALLQERFDVHASSVVPTWTQALELLEAQHCAEDALGESEAKARSTWGTHSAVGAFLEELHAMRLRVLELPAAARALHEKLVAGRSAAAIVRNLDAAGTELGALEHALTGTASGVLDGSWDAVRDRLQTMQDSLDELDEALPVLATLAGLPPRLADVLRRASLTPKQVEAALAGATLERFARTGAGRFDGAKRARHLGRLRSLSDRLLKANAQAVLGRVRRRFLQNVRLSGLSAAELREDEKGFKKRYAAGRRELEHEFGKSMRYRPIRELLSSPAGDVMFDLKPVWLMSPLSVSDTLPLAVDRFDVVIFDEASQITLQAAVPSLFRARQAIVVGDQMQLPPTSFFSARGEEEALVVEEDGEETAYDLESDSFLNHAERSLSSTMLGWHYRSRSESLISFSNAAFYHGRLLTVPEEDLAPVARGTGLLDRSVSFHYIEGAVYEKRRNAAEAAAIAKLVRGIFASGTRPSIGIVAFSEAQQSEIERALEDLGREDPDFGRRLEAEVEREDGGQFAGLLVKNLENMQGDERDVVILSVCYGPGPDGRMLMNFGPINQSGGEKRLNVAFSRARERMAIVTSIRHTAITNEYNEGAHCLRQYLRYAEAASAGDAATARRVLQEMTPPQEREAEPEPDPVARRIAEAMKARGFEADFQVGQSHFRVDLALRRPGDTTYRLGVLLDGGAASGVLVRDVMQPDLLRAFGWRVAQVLAKDWVEDPAGVVAALERAMENGQRSTSNVECSGIP